MPLNRVLRGLSAAAVVVAVLPLGSTAARADACSTAHRYAVETGLDADAAAVDTASATTTTVTALAAVAAPSAPPYPDAHRLAPVEVTVYSLHATVTAVRRTADGDDELVLSDGTTTMTALVADPTCVDPSSPFAAGVTAAWHAIETRYAPTMAPRTVSDGATMRGVGFFDDTPDPWDAANGLELHPLLDVGFDVAPPAQAGAYFTPLSPTRLLDTRNGTGLPDGVAARVRPHAVVTLPVAGRAGVPTDAVAAVLTVTAVGATAASYVTVFPGSASAPPTASNLNVPAGVTVANAVTARLGEGAVKLYNSAGALDLVADIAGYFAAGEGSTFTAAEPQRLLDTRTGTGAPARRVPAGGWLDLAAAGANGVPTDATAVLLNVTGVGAAAATYLSAYPTPAGSAPPPTASNLNLAAGATRAALVTVQVGAGGAVRLYNRSGTVDVLADLAGWYSADPYGSTFTPVDPARLLDTRSGLGTPGTVTMRQGPGGLVDVAVAEMSGVPSDATAAVLNVTVVRPDTGTYLQAYGTPTSGFPIPTASMLNLAAGDVVPNLAVLSIGAGGRVRLRNNAGTVDTVADLAGFFTAPGAPGHGAPPPTPLLRGVTVSALPAPASPAQGTTVTLNVVTTPASAVTATATFATSSVGRVATADAAGHASVTFDVGTAPAGRPVPVAVRVSDVDYRAVAATGTSFLPHSPAGTVAGTPELTVPSADGRVAAITRVGGVIVVGGSFTSIGGYPRRGLAALDATTHAVLPGWVANVDGVVSALASTPSGTGVVVGGSFTAVNGMARANLAAVALSSGAVSAWNPSPDNEVLALSSSTTVTYVGGKFTRMHGVLAGRLVAVDPAGHILPGFAPRPDSFVSALLLHGGTLVAGGDFMHIGGATHWSVAMLSSATGRPSAWNGYPRGCPHPVLPNKNNCAILGLAADPAFTRLYSATAGGYNRIYSFSTTTGSSSYIRVDGNPQAVALFGNTLYAGGHFTYDFTHAVIRRKLIALNASTLKPTAWGPALDSPLGVWALYASPSTGLLAGGDFITVNGATTTPHLAGFRLLN